jgi:ribosomal subunit interface protein
MKTRVLGSNVEVGQSLTDFACENLEKSVKKYFEKAVSGEVHFSKEGDLFRVVITVNEGVKGGINVKSDGEAGDAYAAFSEACDRAAKQLRRYKRKIKHYRRHGGIKFVEPNYKGVDATKYVIPPFETESESDESSDEIHIPHSVVAEKATEIETLSVDDAIMKMDLQNLPALVFINEKSKRMNVVYHRKDGNISWVDPQV